MAPETLLSHLHRADGSATYSHNGYCIIGAVNGPIDVPRKDELAEEATIEVNIRMASGPGSPRERHLETLLMRTLRAIILTREIPRTLVQITLQVRSLPEDAGSGGKSNSSLPLLPHLFHTSLLSLLSASIPLSTTLTSVLIGLSSSSPIPIVSPTAKELLAQPITSLHVFVFSGNKKLLLAESEGAFGHEEWDEACEVAEEACCNTGGVDLGEGMEVDGAEGNLEEWLRKVVRDKVENEQRWKKAS
jgi:exosome complex component RRP46